MKVIVCGFLFALIVLSTVGCSITRKTQTASSSPLQPNANQAGQLQEDQLLRIKTLQQTFAEVDETPLDEWIDNFKRNADPNREIMVWERIAEAYTRYCSLHPLTVEAKKEVFSILVTRSMVSEDEALKQIKPKLLTINDAKEVMSFYTN
jgi:hypothetical protein